MNIRSWAWRPMASRSYVDTLRQLIYLKPDGGFELDLSYFRHHVGGVNMTWDDGEPTMDAGLHAEAGTSARPCPPA